MYGDDTGTEIDEEMRDMMDGWMDDKGKVYSRVNDRI